jgi:hypothetical protein
MKATLLVLVFFLVLPFILVAQVSLAYQAGYGTYRMSSLSEYQKNVLKESNFPAEIVTSFPGYFNHKIVIGIPVKMAINKFYAGYLTTAGRISLTDYSGKWLFDQTLNAFQAGLQADHSFYKFKDFEIKGYINLGLTTTLMRLYQYLSVAEEKFDESYLFVGYGIDFQPGLELIYTRSKFSFGVFAGYEQGFSKAFFKKGSPKIKVGTSSDNLVNPDWAGLRTGFQVGYTLGK